MLINILHAPDKPLQYRIIQPKRSTVLKLRNSTIKKESRDSENVATFHLPGESGKCPGTHIPGIL